MSVPQDVLNNEIFNLPEDVDQTVSVLQLITGEQDHKPFWCYVSMYPSKYLEYSQKVIEQEDLIIEDYGIVLAKGWGELPPQDIQEQMKQEFGADPQFEDKVQDLIKEIQKQSAENA